MEGRRRGGSWKGEKGEEEGEEETFACSRGTEIEDLQPFGCNGTPSLYRYIYIYIYMLRSEKVIT